MATSFNSGFRLGTDMFNQAERNRLLRDQEAREAEAHKQRMEEAALRTDALRRAATREQEATGLRQQLSDFTQGVDRPATNAALDADFEAANQAALRGVQLPAVRGGSNMANAEALKVTNPVDVTSAGYRQGLAGLRGRLALATGNDRDFDAIQDAERLRIQGQQDADYAKAVMTDPTGAAAKSARSFINGNSQRLSTKVDPKTGITTFALVQGDGYEEIKVSPADLGKIAVGFRRLERGDVGGLDVIAAVNKDLAAVARDELKLQLDVGAKTNDANYKIAGLQNDAARTANQASYYRYLQGRLQQQDNRTAAADAFQRKVDGVLEGYQAAMAAGPAGRDAAAIYAREYDQLRATAPRGLRLPNIQSLNNAQRSPKDEKPVEVPEQGKIMMRGGKRFMTDGLGGEIEIDPRGRPLGVMPSDRDNFVTKNLGMPPAMANQLEFSKDGRFILAPNGAEYDTQDKGDMARIKADITAFAAQDPVEYERRMLLNRSPAPNGLAFGPRITYAPDPRAPSIYAGPEAWAAYRARQQQGQ